MAKPINMAGQQIGYLKVLERCGNNKNGKVLWKCLCTACGKEYVTTSSQLRKKVKNKSCGCLMGKRKDLSGQKFGHLTALSYYGVGENESGAQWLCKCDCGKEIVVSAKNLIHHDITSCGCMKTRCNLIGHRYGRLLVVSKAESKNGRAYWNCVCDCGNTKVVSSCCLSTGKTTSCGCYKREKAKKLWSTSRSKDLKLYNIWCSMKNRCYRVKDTGYANYGGRGIKICSEWLEDYENFYQWAMTNGYEHGLEIDRIDYNGDYCPENCRWVDRYVQANNKRNIKKYTINGKTQSLAEWCREYSLDYYLVRQRVYKMGWTIEQALTIAPCK